jgi:hypothetical protein
MDLDGHKQAVVGGHSMVKWQVVPLKAKKLCEMANNAAHQEMAAITYRSWLLPASS